MKKMIKQIFRHIFTTGLVLCTILSTGQAGDEERKSFDTTGGIKRLREENISESKLDLYKNNIYGDLVCSPSPQNVFLSDLLPEITQKIIGYLTPEGRKIFKALSPKFRKLSSLHTSCLVLSFDVPLQAIKHNNHEYLQKIQNRKERRIFLQDCLDAEDFVKENLQHLHHYFPNLRQIFAVTNHDEDVTDSEDTEPELTLTLGSLNDDDVTYGEDMAPELTISLGDLSELQHLKTLDLTNLMTMKNPDLKKLTNLTELDLSHNPSITDKVLRELTNLKILTIGNNKLITGEGFSHLPNLNTLRVICSLNDYAQKCIKELTTLSLLSIPASGYHNTKAGQFLTMSPLKILMIHYYGEDEVAWFMLAEQVSSVIKELFRFSQNMSEEEKKKKGFDSFKFESLREEYEDKFLLLDKYQELFSDNEYCGEFEFEVSDYPFSLSLQGKLTNIQNGLYNSKYYHNLVKYYHKNPYKIPGNLLGIASDLFEIFKIKFKITTHNWEGKNLEEESADARGAEDLGIESDVESADASNAEDSNTESDVESADIDL
jgi:hypothetical protein